MAEHAPDSRPRLLDELESIKALLEQGSDTPAACSRQPSPPALEPASAPQDALLDLDRIFEDDSDPLERQPGPGPESTDAAMPRFVLDDAAMPTDEPRSQLIQALIERLLPQIEAELRDNLGSLDIETLREWHLRQR